VSAAEGFLEELAGRPAEKGGPLVLKLPRAPVSREQRWAHLLSGPIDVSALPTASDVEWFVPVSELAALKVRVSATDAELARLKSLVERLCRELDVRC
jgi:uncharacterized protein